MFVLIKMCLYHYLSTKCIDIVSKCWGWIVSCFLGHYNNFFHPLQSLVSEIQVSTVESGLVIDRLMFSLIFRFRNAFRNDKKQKTKIKPSHRHGALYVRTD